MATHGWHEATIYGEDGWELDGAVWNENHGAEVGEPTLASFLASTASLPAEEAERIAELVLREWNERQDTAEVAYERRLTKVGVRTFTAVVVLALLGGVLGLALLVWLVVAVL